MQITINQKDDTPIYQQIVDCISRDILNGTLPPGHRLPTVRDLAEDSGVSRGTVKHAYDRLEQLGFIEMTQGRGTFVSERQNSETASKKDQAMQAIDEMLDEMLGLSFTLRDIRIFFDLKMREREEQLPCVRIGAVDCNPEALSVILGQLSTFQGVEIQQFLLESVLRDPEQLDRELDLIVTTTTHYADLEYKAPRGVPLMRMALSVTPGTVLKLARLDSGVKAGVVAASNRFASIVLNGLGKFSALSRQPDISLFGDKAGLEGFAAGKDTLIVPAGHHMYCSNEEEEVLARFAEAGKTIIGYEYQIDRGSFLYIGEQIEKIYAAAKQ